MLNSNQGYFLIYLCKDYVLVRGKDDGILILIQSATKKAQSLAELIQDDNLSLDAKCAGDATGYDNIDLVSSKGNILTFSYTKPDNSKYLFKYLIN